MTQVSLDTPDYTDRVLPLNSVVNSIAIDYDPVEGRVYWTDLEDDSRQSIRSALLASPHNESDVVSRDVDHPDGVAVDWAGRNLFWTDSGTDRIEVARLDGASRRVVISEDLDEPRSIVLELGAGWMFWSDWGKVPRIERAWLDGRQRQVIADTELVWPNGLALDSETGLLYWCDAKLDRIEVAGLDGADRRVLTDHDLPHPFGFSLLGDFIYWTDWQDRNIQRASKLDGGRREVMVSHLDDLMGAKAVLTSPNPSLLASPCAPASSPCSHLCLLTPGGPVCACPTGHELGPDNSSCLVPAAFLLYTRRDDIRRVSIERETQQEMLIPLKGVTEASALDYDRTDGRIYWSDIALKTISRAWLNGSGLEAVVEHGLDYPRGLAVDSAAGNLYWADAGTGRVEMAGLGGGERRVLAWAVTSPECLVLDPAGERLLWSVWGDRPVIEMAGLAGQDRRVVVRGAGRATGLTVDPEHGLLYWTDQDSLTISVTRLTAPHSTSRLHAATQHPYALTLYAGSLYWTDWVGHTVSRLELGGEDSSPAVLQTGLDYVMDLLAYERPGERAVVGGPCSEESGCPGLCVPQDGQPSCLCPSHYRLQADNTCAGPPAFLLFSQKNKISRLVPPEVEGEVPDLVLPIKKARSIQSVAYDQTEDMIYWVDHGRGEQPGRQLIRRARDTGDTPRIPLFDRLERFLPFDLAVDPATRSLYWTSADAATVNVTRLGAGEELTGLGAVLVAEQGERPRLLALDPVRQLLYLSLEAPLQAGLTPAAATTTRLERLSLVSGSRDLIFSGLASVSALAADTAGQLYWADGMDRKIEAVDWEGVSRRLVVSEGVVEPVGLAVLGSWLYWADRDQAVIVRVDKLTGTGRQVVLSKVARLSSLTGVTRLEPGLLAAQPCARPTACSHFCAADPAGSSLPLCSCPPGLSLAPDNRTCGLPPTCQPSEFSCGSRGAGGAGPACIPLQWRCDGQSECADRSDELDCPDCGPAQFRCQSGQCVASSRLCDGTADCDDRTDEQLCCGPSQFQCAVTGECVARAKLCDGAHDCGDSSDELLPKCSTLPTSPGSAPPLCCPDPASRRLATDGAAAPTSTSFYLIAVFAVLISIFLVSLVVVYCVRRTSPVVLEPEGARVVCGAGEVDGERDGGVGGEPGVGGPGSSNGLLYDRSRLTGASSTAGTSSSGGAGGQFGPPPSPATSAGTKLSRLTGAGQVRRGRNGPHAFSAGLSTGYRFYTQPRGPPPCTPCSTDAADETDSLAYSAFPHRPHFPSRAGSVAPSRTGYDSESCMSGVELPSLQERGRYAPPPTTPLYLSDYGEAEVSPPASPTTERSFFLNPCLPGPPPSPVPSPPI